MNKEHSILHTFGLRSLITPLACVARDIMLEAYSSATSWGIVGNLLRTWKKQNKDQKKDRRKKIIKGKRWSILSCPIQLKEKKLDCMNCCPRSNSVNEVCYDPVQSNSDRWIKWRLLVQQNAKENSQQLLRFKMCLQSSRLVVTCPCLLHITYPSTPVWTLILSIVSSTSL